MVLLVICSDHHEVSSQGEPIYDWETQADEFIVERMRQRIENALARYKPMREERDVAMAPRRRYERTTIT